MNPDRMSKLQNFIRMITTAVSTSLLYSIDHQQVSRLCATAHDNLDLAMNNDLELSLMIIDDELIAEDRPVPQSMYINRLCQLMKVRKLSHLRILKGVTEAELKYLVTTLAKQGGGAEEVKPTENIRFGRVEVKHGEATSGEQPDSKRKRKLMLEDIPVEELSAFMDIYQEARQNKRLNLSGITEIVGCFIDSFIQVSDPLLALAPLRAMDEYTFTHSTNVCILNLAQAISLGIEGPLLNDIGVSAMLHDIGKLYIPEEILNKPGKLDDSEFEIIKTHPAKGAQRLMDTPGVPRLAIINAYEHHMKFNGSGYPKAPAGWNQHICSQMTTISDIFDAMRTKRSYKEAMEFDKISSIMLGLSETELHPGLTRNFLSLIGKLAETP